jgi:hypothetical protein
MAPPDYDALVEWLRATFGDGLRWTASFNHARFTYRVQYIRDDLKTELTDRELDTIVHRSLAVFNRQHVEDVYFHLGDAEGLLVQHERAIAAHVFLTEETGVVVKLRRDAEVTVPTFFEECLDRLGVESA